MWISIGLMGFVILSLTLGVFYYTEYERYQQLYSETLLQLKKYEPYMFVSLLINYGNGTQVWHNNTLVSIGASLLNATRIVSNIDYTLGQWGAFVTHINGVGDDPNTFWVFNIWNSTSTSWDYGLVGAEAYILKEKEIVSWVYQKF